MVSDYTKQAFVLFGVAVVTAALILGLYKYSKRPRPEVRADVAEFANEIKLGDTQDEVKRKFQSQQRKYLDPHFSADSALWSVGTDWEFGSGNWILWINFENSQVIGIAVRTADGVRHKPDGSPPDRGQIRDGWEPK